MNVMNEWMPNEKYASNEWTNMSLKAVLASVDVIGGWSSQIKHLCSKLQPGGFSVFWTHDLSVGRLMPYN